MSDHLPDHGALLAQLKQQLVKEGYCPGVCRSYAIAAEHFLRYLRRRRIAFDALQPSHIAMHLRCELRRYQRRYGRAPSSESWRTNRLSGIHRLLRLVIGQWPPSSSSSNPYELSCQALGNEYRQWLCDRRNLAAETIHGLAAEARRFLAWYAQRASAGNLLELAITDIDAYLRVRALGLRRSSRKQIAGELRCFLRFLHAMQRTSRDFSPSVIAPTLYAFESIPSALRPEEIHAVLKMTRTDRSAQGLRDYAILLLLSTYGLRAGEITQLRLDDIDWRAERFGVRQTKTGSQLDLPLLPTVGKALFDYLRRGRPKTEDRELFIRACAPFRAFRSGSSLYSNIRARLEAAGVQPNGKRGPHAFRHAHAVSLLRAGVSLKAIGDLLGHRSAASTMPYLKLATAELRGVAMEIPAQEVQP
jgi:integrase/recombinase XerD